MDKPITDFVFVCSPEKAPKGYTVITACPCGRDAQLWEKVLGGADGTRYLCFTKEEQSDDKLVEDMYIPGPSQQYLKKGYRIIKNTVEGEEPMRHKQLAVKRVPVAQVEKAVVDVIVSRSRDKISKLYTKMTRVNGLRIAFRKGNPITSGSMDTNTCARGSLDECSPSSPASSSSHSPSPVDLTPYSPSPLLTPPDNEVSFKYISPLGSSLPPSTSPTPAPQPMAPSVPPATTQTQFPVSFDDTSSSSAPYSVPAHAPPPQTQVATHTPTYPPAAMTTTPTSYPPAVGGGYYPPQGQGPQLPYQMRPPGQFYPPTAGYGQPRGVASSAPPSYPTTGYDTNIGFSFGGTAPPPGPAPYNPYHHQQQQQQQQQQQYGGSSSTPIYPPPPGARANTPWGGPPQRPGPPSQQNPNYGFNF